MNTSKLGIFIFAIFVSTLFLPHACLANDLKVSNVRLGARDTSAKTLAVLFDLSWNNSWRNKINHDAVWLTVRLSDASSGQSSILCPISLSGLNPAGSSLGSNGNIEIVVPDDKIGAFLRRSSNSVIGNVSTTALALTVNYASCGFSDSTQVTATVVGLEMVYVPKGSFYAGDYATSTASFQRGTADNTPWPVTSESALNVTGAAANGYYYVSAGNTGEVASGTSFVIPAAFPKGFNDFYMMKYEITEGQWVGFVNSLSSAARSARDVTNSLHKNSDAVIARNTVSCSGNPLVCSTEKTARAMSFLSWQDFTAFLDWVGLRPMTELEFEKAARGPFLPVSGEYAWGSSKIVAATTLSGLLEDGTELVTTQGANARFNNVLLSGGDALNGTEYQQGPLRAGIFSTDSSDRKASGAGNYGAMELSGNVAEWVVSVGNSYGLAFTGLCGDGILTTTTGSEGNANVLAWPGMATDVSLGVVSSNGAGFRGGSWASASGRLSISDRMEAASAASNAASTYGGRGVRSAEGL